ncbi:uncharacterized protein [Magallana gigas]|uniref:uncharacterized protein n=1 Tax=Magallana gigas TaxID=29159 RepID=UPI00333F847E
MLRQYGVPEKLISLICNTYHRMTYKVADVVLVQINYLDFADDLALLSHHKNKCRTKTASTGAGIKIKVDNRKWKITTTSQTPVANVDEPIKVEPFIYPGSMVGTQSGQDRDIKPKIGKASAAFTMLKNIWASRFG